MDTRVSDAIAVLGRVSAPVNAAAIGPKTRKRTRLERLVEENSAPPPPVRPPREEPWRRDQYLARLASFARSRDWFAKPEAASPAQCARRGWHLERCNVLACTTCGAHLSLTASLGAQAPADVEALTQAFVGRLRTTHDATCPWRRWCCPSGFAAVTCPPPHTLLACLALCTAREQPSGDGRAGASLSSRCAERAAAALALAGGAPCSGPSVIGAVDAAAALLTNLAGRLGSAAPPREAALLALFGWAPAAAAPPAPGTGRGPLRCALCDAAYDPAAPTLPAEAPPQPTAAPAAGGAAAAAASAAAIAEGEAHGAENVAAGGQAGFMVAAKRALAAASRAWSTFRGLPSAGAPVAAAAAAAAGGAAASLPGAPEPLLDAHRWHCPVIRSSAVLPAALAPLVGRLADASAALVHQLEQRKHEAVPAAAAAGGGVGAAAAARGVAADAREAARGRRREEDDALRRAVAAGLASLASAALAVVDDGALAGLGLRPPSEAGTGRASAELGTSEHWHDHASDEEEGYGAGPRSAEPQPQALATDSSDSSMSGAIAASAAGSSGVQTTASQRLRSPTRIPGWLLTTLAVIHASEMCSTPSGGDVLPF